MPKIDLCIDPLFPGLNSTEKVREIAKLNFNAIEFWFWDREFDGVNLLPVEKNINEIASITADYNITVNDIVVNAPDGSIGGSLTVKADREIYLSRLQKTIEIAKKLRCKKLITCSGNFQMNVSVESQKEAIIETLGKAAEIAGKEGITLLLESLNSTIDHPGYFIISSKGGFEIIKQVNSPYLKLLYDIYHMQIMEGNIINTIKENISLIGHFHAAGLPGRNELYSGEINYLEILRNIDAMAYSGYFGLEYWPTFDTKESLIATSKYLHAALGNDDPGKKVLN